MLRKYSRVKFAGFEAYLPSFYGAFSQRCWILLLSKERVKTVKLLFSLPLPYVDVGSLGLTADVR